MSERRDLNTKTGVHPRNRALLIGFGILALIGILIPATFNYLLAGDNRVYVVNLRQGASQADREMLKQACGTLAGVSVIADRGAAEAQYRFPVRFRIGDSTFAEQSALDACLARYPGLVRGVTVEKDDI